MAEAEPKKNVRKVSRKSRSDSKEGKDDQDFTVDFLKKKKDIEDKITADGALRLRAQTTKQGDTVLLDPQERPVDAELLAREQVFQFELPDNAGQVCIRLREDPRLPSDGEAPHRIIVRIREPGPGDFTKSDSK